MEKQTPDFAIFQNSRTMQSAIWTKEVGKWIQCEPREYAPLAVIVNLLRHSPNPQAVMEELQKVSHKIQEEEL